MCADTRVKAHTIDDGLCIQSFHFGVGIQLVEVAHTQSQISIGKKFHGLGLGQSHEERVDVSLDCSFL